MKPRTSTKVHPRSGSGFWTIFSVSLFLLLALFVLTAGVASSQNIYPRMGLSASPDEYVDTLEVVPGEEFTLYVCIFGPGPGEPVDQPFTSLSWVIHQVCCGAEVDILSYDLNPDLTNEGHPLVGVLTTSESCYDQETTLLATLNCSLDNPTPGGVLWAAGPADASYDCEGGNALFMGMAVTMVVDEDVLPFEDSSWGSIKAIYR
jgi:hypothetical protein